MPDARAIQHPKTKKYVVVKPVDNPDGFDGDWKKGDFIRIDPTDFTAYIAGGFIVPYDTALRQGLYTPSTKKTVKISTPSEPEPTVSATTDTPKTLIGNKLRDAVQKKKTDDTKSDSAESKPSTTKSTSSTSISEDKLKAIKSGGK